MRRKTPIGALAEGLIAGVIGAGVQSLFFRATRSPTPPKRAFVPPEPQQHKEGGTETVARRLVEGLARRGPLDEHTKRRAGAVVHYGYGAAWGGLYGLLRGSYPRLWSPTGVAGFALGAWALSDNLVLPGLRVAAWPQRYPLRMHAYGIAAHLAYGAGVAGALASVDHADTALLVGAVALARGRLLGRRAVDRSRALVPREFYERSRHLAQALARRARDLRPS